MRNPRFPLAALLVTALAALPVAAGTLAGVSLPDRADADGQSLVLNGMGLRKKLFIKVYVGGLYLPSKESSASKILAADAPRRMVMHFLYDVSPEQMCDAWKEGLELTTPSPAADVQKSFQTLCGWMDGVGKGQKLALTYLPGKGTTVEVGGKVKGTVEGKATSDAILRTWLHEKAAPGADFREGVLGG
jgi:hypothetical protein